ncbi:MAG: DUF3147 domain-containing protein [Nitrospirota bacterium]
MKFLAYFLVGGAVVTLVTFVGATGRSLLSAFIATFPAITLITTIFIYLEAGSQPTTDYVKGLLIFAPAWLGYLVSLFVLLPRLALINAIAASLAVFLAGVALTRLVRTLF